MENPMTWGRAERIVDRVLKEDRQARASGEFRVGLSLTRRITDALRAENLLDDPIEPPRVGEREQDE